MKGGKTDAILICSYLIGARFHLKRAVREVGQIGDPKAGIGLKGKGVLLMRLPRRNDLRETTAVSKIGHSRSAHTWFNQFGPERFGDAQKGKERRMPKRSDV